MTAEIPLASKLNQSIAHMILQHLQDECGDGDACITVSDRTAADQLRGEILLQCSWLKDCTTSPGIDMGDRNGYTTYLLSDMSNENVHITTDPDFEKELPSWVGLRLRIGNWR